MSLSETVVVFDLDDTLYKEVDYKRSGVLSVCAEINTLYRQDLTTELLATMDEGGDIWQVACDKLKLPASAKESLLWIYRMHSPSIEMSETTRVVINNIATKAQHIAILTDGRSITQRKKIKTLGLTQFPVYISEEWSSNKPDSKRFKSVMQDFPSDQYCYIGDNATKDFFAPNQLGWLTIGLRDDGRNIHKVDINTLPGEYQPKQWIDNLAELEKLYFTW